MSTPSAERAAVIERLFDGGNLDEQQARQLLMTLTDPGLAPAVAGAILGALRVKGVTAAELRGLAGGLRELAMRPPFAVSEDMIDIVGTGGDGSRSLNISTGTALLSAACGLPVVKHGNRAISSRSGSADLLAALGLPMPMDGAMAARCLQETGFTFLFAPFYHPAMRSVAPIRAALATRTVFNILGPLANPAEPPCHLIGVYDLELARLMAETLSGMNVRRSFVIRGYDGWDEPTTVGEFHVFDVTPGRVESSVRDARDYGFDVARPEQLLGADSAHNADVLRRSLRGELPGPYLDCLLLGAGLALEITGRVADCGAGIALARRAIADGSAAATLARIEGFAANA
ncbi:MAG: anthranilate phosphoribosyltransferase [Steroidobacteraceae bacterium]